SRCSGSARAPVVARAGPGTVPMPWPPTGCGRHRIDSRRRGAAHDGRIGPPSIERALEDAMNPATTPGIAPRDLASLPPYAPTPLTDFGAPSNKAAFEQALAEV